MFLFSLDEFKYALKLKILDLDSPFGLVLSKSIFMIVISKLGICCTDVLKIKMFCLGGDCPSFGVHYQPHVDAEITYNVKSWSACSNLCRFRRACQFWSWVDENGGRWAFKCTTMTNIPNITMTENNIVSGGRDCGYIEGRQLSSLAFRETQGTNCY